MATSASSIEERTNMSHDLVESTSSDTVAVKDSMTPGSQTDDPEAKIDHHAFAGLPQNRFHEAAFVFVVCCAQLMTQAGLSLSIAPLQIISDSFNTTPKDLSWASAGYSLTVGTFIFVSGRLGDEDSLYGPIRDFSTVAVHFKALDRPYCYRTPLQSLEGHTPPGRRKGMVFCLFGAVAPGGFTLGATFSSLLAERVWWPWGYWIFGIACFIFALLGYFSIPYVPQQKPREDLSVFQRLDTYGAITGVSGLILINFAWNQASLVGWGVPYTYVMLIVGILIMALFLFVESKAAYPLLPRSVLVGEAGWVLGCIAAGWSSFGVVVFYYYNILEELEGNSGLLVTAKWAGASLSGACAAVITGLLLGRISASIIMFVAMLAFSAGQALLASMPIGQVYWANAFVIMLITPWGMDMSFPSGIVILSNAMPQQDQGVAGSLVNTVVNYSISMGLGFAGVVEYYVGNDGENVLVGYRAASYMGVGLAGLGTIIATCFMLVTWRDSRKASS
ncbi:hypothetical protein N7509_006865 [Penicillium cosmopolitanum]|uniref:Major facilitator superfamily (MFS) profile domain-containing protein n=1 Tax=Penicillium cosmopolitanum TaxID=1131564 RepID=A0A9W9VY52_9EURO|nr:uncharacterized protein N7509_006865 [Penicillium cosmopolitanum]KAJ5391375.1 hypothetical protein N7509_006865 [Penicillium cosmopolitanum]